MEALMLLDPLTAGLLMALAFATVLMQLVHGLTMMERRDSRFEARLGAVYECALVVPLTLLLMLLYDAYEPDYGTYIVLWALYVPLFPLLYANLAFALAAAAVAVRLRLPQLGIDTLALLALFPPIAGALDPRVTVPLALAWFLFRGLFVILRDLRTRSQRLSTYSITQTMMELPEGLMLAQPNGRVLLLNDTMRTRLLQLGMRRHLSDLRDLWQALMRAGTLTEAGAIAVTVDQGPHLLFFQDDVRFDQDDYVMCWCCDVTEEMRLQDELRTANQQLAETAAGLETQLQNVEQVAEHEAVLAMRARVHDVISQRLSILSSMLQSGRTDDATLAQLKPLLTSVLDDLSASATASAPVDIPALQQAFALIGVQIQVTGQLPRQEQARLAFLKVLREASTNAVKHAQASRIDVTFGRTPAVFAMTISNNGTPPMALKEGNGMAGMRRRIEQLGGTFAVTQLDPFTLSARIPYEEDPS